MQYPNVKTIVSCSYPEEVEIKEQVETRSQGAPRQRQRVVTDNPYSIENLVKNRDRISTRRTGAHNKYYTIDELRKMVTALHIPTAGNKKSDLVAALQQYLDSVLKGEHN